MTRTTIAFALALAAVTAAATLWDVSEVGTLAVITRSS